MPLSGVAHQHARTPGISHNNIACISLETRRLQTQRTGAFRHRYQMYSRSICGHAVSLRSTNPAGEHPGSYMSYVRIHAHHHAYTCMREGLINTPRTDYQVEVSRRAASACHLRETCVGGTFCAAHASPSHLNLLPATLSLVRGLSLSCPLYRVFRTRPQHPRPSLQENTATAGA